MNTTNITREKPKAEDWFKTGNRLAYDFQLRTVLDEPNDNNSDKIVRVWTKLVNANSNDSKYPFITMMPGFPDGSFGWAATEHYLYYTSKEPRLYMDYIGMGDSDKPEGYDYGVRERADMIEALWRHHGVKSSILVTFDFSSLVALELLSRQIEGECAVHITHVLFINGGLFADSHSHPILTTPLLKTSFGRMGAKMAQKSSFAFNMMMKDLWSKEYGVTKDELAENHKAIGRREGTVFMSNAAGFVDEHKSNAHRWDLKRIFTATNPKVKYIVAGSEKDQFEPKQVLKAKKELEHLGLGIVKFPGGHMTTSEYPDLIANTIEQLKSFNKS